MGGDCPSILQGSVSDACHQAVRAKDTVCAAHAPPASEDIQAARREPEHSQQPCSSVSCRASMRPLCGWRGHKRAALRLVLAAVGISCCTRTAATGMHLGGHIFRVMSEAGSANGATFVGAPPRTLLLRQSRGVAHNASLGTSTAAFVPVPCRQAAAPGFFLSSICPRHQRRSHSHAEEARRQTPTLQPRMLPLKMSQGSSTPEGSEVVVSKGPDAARDAFTTTLSSRPRSDLWGNWTEHQVKVATLLWIEKIVIGMKLCPFAVEAMNGLRVYVSDAMNRDMALDNVDVEIKWIVGLDKSRPACTLMVYPPALFELGGGVSRATLHCVLWMMQQAKTPTVLGKTVKDLTAL